MDISPMTCNLPNHGGMMGVMHLLNIGGQMQPGILPGKYHNFATILQYMSLFHLIIYGFVCLCIGLEKMLPYKLIMFVFMLFKTHTIYSFILD